MKTKSQSQEIHDMIMTAECPADQRTILDILLAMNRRMDEIESASDRANHVASCLANGIQPD